jgi:glutathione S-transferase
MSVSRLPNGMVPYGPGGVVASVPRLSMAGPSATRAQSFNPAQQQPAAPQSRLYIHHISADSLGPWMLLRQTCLPADLVFVDPTRAETQDPGFLAMNPMGELPVFVSPDGTVVWEPNTILRYICEKFPAAEHFYPRDVNLRGRVDMALDWRQSTLMPALEKVAYPYLGFSKDKSRINEGKADLDQNLRVLTDFFLRETPFIGGSIPSIADYSVALPLLYLYGTDYRLSPKVRDYLETLAGATPAWNEVTENLKNFMATLK